jgi:hypothetical protein
LIKDSVVFLSSSMANDKDHVNPEERHQGYKPLSSSCGDRLLSVFTTSEKATSRRAIVSRFGIEPRGLFGCGSSRNQVRKHISSGLRFFKSRSSLRRLYRVRPSASQFWERDFRLQPLREELFDQRDGHLEAPAGLHHGQGRFLLVLLTDLAG